MSANIDLKAQDEREAFEAWAAHKFMMHRHAAGGYSGMPTQCAWAAWQARATLAAPQPAAREYACPVNTVADLVNNLLMMDQSLPIHAAQYIQIAGRRRAIAVPPTVSVERVQDGRWIGEGDSLNAAVIWTRAARPGVQAQPAAQPADAQDIAHWKRDSELLSAIEAGSWDVRFGSSANADAGDYNITIEIVAHFMAHPRERVIGENYSENLRAALEQAVTAAAYPPARPEYDQHGNAARTQGGANG